MAMDNPEDSQRLEIRLATLEMAMRPQGVLGELAKEALGDTHAELTNDEAADILLPPKAADQVSAPRWQLVENARPSSKRRLKERS
jgi:hypothetical protein